MTDYVVCGAVQPERVAAIVSGVARGCTQAGCALLGGETAEHPGHFGPDDFDLAGAATGVVEADAILGPEHVQPGDTVLAMASSGLHSNGYSLVREILRQAGLVSDRRDGKKAFYSLRPGLPHPVSVSSSRNRFCHSGTASPTRWRPDRARTTSTEPVGRSPAGRAS